jgi:hypothetical protein
MNVAVDPAVSRDELQDLMTRARMAESAGDLRQAVDLYTAAARVKRTAKLERRLVRLRHDLFDTMEPSGPATWPPSLPDDFPPTPALPEITPDQLTASTLGSAITNRGCLIVRGLFDGRRVKRFRRVIDEALAASGQQLDRGAADDTSPWFQRFQPNDRHREADLPGQRVWLRHQGSMYAGDSPRALFELIEAFEETRVLGAVTEHFGERPAFGLQKCSLRLLPTDGGTSWHQDGAFLGPGIRAVNVWITLTPCGGDDPSTPALDIVPRRFDHVLETGTRGAIFDWSVGTELVDELTADAPVVRPRFEAGDAVLFDDLLLHQTGLSESMTVERYGLETWLFAPSAYPPDQIPIAI